MASEWNCAFWLNVYYIFVCAWVEINCGHPGRLWNGWLENIEGGTGLGASIIFRCHEGMTLEGNTSTVCQIDGKWRYPLPKCLGVYLGWEESFFNFSYMEKMAICWESQNWICYTFLKLVCYFAAPCVVPQVAQGRVILLSQNDTAISSTVVPHGEALDVECDQQYEFLASSSPVTCNNGTWTHIPKCQPARQVNLHYRTYKL